MPPSVNAAYYNVAGRGRVKSTPFRNYEAEVRIWIAQNTPQNLYTDSKQPLALYLYFYSTKGKLWTLDGRVKKWDCSNRIKLSEDSISAMLGFDDSRFFEVHAFKCVSTRSYVDAIITDALIDKPGVLKLN